MVFDDILLTKLNILNCRVLFVIIALYAKPSSDDFCQRWCKINCYINTKVLRTFIFKYFFLIKCN